jgi:hypothetical protein
MTAATVALVDLGRSGALGARRRLESWTSVFTAAGATVEVVRLVEECRTPRSWLLPAVAATVVDPERVPESALWRPVVLRERLAALRPDVVLTLTARSFAPRCAPTTALEVLDYVDHLSANYEQRAQISGGRLRAAGFHALAWQMRRFERRELPGARRVAAGAADALALGAEWVPNVVTLPSRPAPGCPAHDLLFMGSLGYEPNVAALRRLARLWPQLQAVRPGTTLLVAGRAPTAEVRRLAETSGWSIHGDFADLGDVCSSARLSVAPLQHGTGIQNKVLDAAAHGLAQIVTPNVLAGVGADFPAVVAETDVEWVATIARLLDDPAEMASLGRRGRQAVIDGFGVDRWATWAADLLRNASAPDRGRSGSASAASGSGPR